MASPSSFSSSSSSSSSEVRSVVFVPDSELVWVQAVVESTNEEDGSYVVDINDPEYIALYRGKAAPTKKTVYLKDLPPPYESFPLQNNDVIHSKEGKDDMCDLNFLHEPSILDNLHRRFKEDHPYTYTGDICIAVNPYQWLSIYTEAVQEEYIEHFRHELRPHVYASSSSSYRGIRDYKRNQSILVSGESGAGKTETVKILMGHIAHVAGKKYDSTIDKVLKSNPLLESFGNARTVRNDNSSRFGKFTQLQFNDFAKLVGSKCVTYLLEKSRVVSQNQHERNYHIFHELFASSKEMKKKLKLFESKISDFNYMKKGDTKTTVIEGRSDAMRFEETLDTLELLGVSKQEIQSIFDTLAGILHLGQLKFVGEGGDSDKSKIDPSCNSTINTVAQLFKVDVDEFSKGTTIRHIEVVGEEMEVPLNVDQAINARDALAKEIYSRMFFWLVSVINLSTASYDETTSTISLLDIFGFESFSVNRFEQLCINYANEKLQQKFTLDVFQAVQAEYKEEGLEWETISYKDNAHVLQLIEGKAGAVIGVMAILNEECLMPRGSDANLLGKMRKVCNKHEAFSFTHSGAQTKDEFCITHYAGKVAYNINGFVERNKDTLANEARSMMSGSKNTILAEIFSQVSYNPQNMDALDGNLEQASSKRTVSAGSRRLSSFVGAETVVTKFKGQLNSLMQTFGETDVQYVRCIKPNAVKIKCLFDRQMVVEQLRCAGMIEAIRITRAAYPYRVSQQNFVNRFQGLQSKEWNRLNSVDGTKAHCIALLSSILEISTFETIRLNKTKSYEVGKTKVYFSSSVLELLEVLRSKQLSTNIELIQKVYRGSKARRWFEKLKKAVLKIQSMGRMYVQKSKLKRIYNCVISLQCAYRSKRALRMVEYKRYLRNISNAQATIRMFIARSKFSRMRQAASKIGAWIQMQLQLRTYATIKSAHAEQDNLTSKLAELQQRLRSDMISRASSAASDDRHVQNSIPDHGFFDDDNDEEDDDDDVEEDITVLSALKEEMKKLRDTHERLVAESMKLKSEGRKEHYDLDNKIAQMSVGKSKIQVLEKERDELRLEYEILDTQLKHLKTEKQHVVESLLHLSSEVDGVNRERRAWKKLYDTERAIRLSQVLREREIMLHLRHLLRRRGVDYQQITETKIKIHDILHLAAADDHIRSLNSAWSRSNCTDSDSDDITNAVRRRRSSPSPKSGRQRSGQSGSGPYQTIEETENLSIISSVSTHQPVRQNDSDDFAEAHNSPDILTGRSEKADKPLGALRREKEREARSARRERYRRDRRGMKSQTPTDTGKKSKRQQQEDEMGIGSTFADWWASTFSPAPPPKHVNVTKK